MKLQVIVGSTRPGRHSDKLAKWVVSHVEKVGGLEVETVDLKDYPMPLFDEAVSPQYNPDRKPSPEVRKWLDKIAEADGYIIVTPEYNRSIPGVLKNALDYIDFQFANKPVGLVGHGGTGAAQAISTLRNIIPQLKAITIPAVVYFAAWISMVVDDEGIIAEEDVKQGPEGALTQLLDEIKMYMEALDGLRK